MRTRQINVDEALRLIDYLESDRKNYPELRSHLLEHPTATVFAGVSVGPRLEKGFTRGIICGLGMALASTDPEYSAVLDSFFEAYKRHLGENVTSINSARIKPC